MNARVTFGLLAGAAFSLAVAMGVACSSDRGEGPVGRSSSAVSHDAAISLTTNTVHVLGVGLMNDIIVPFKAHGFVGKCGTTGWPACAATQADANN